MQNILMLTSANFLDVNMALMPNYEFWSVEINRNGREINSFFRNKEFIVCGACHHKVVSVHLHTDSK